MKTTTYTRKFAWIIHGLSGLGLYHIRLKYYYLITLNTKT